MLLLWCLSMIQVFSYPLGKSSFHLFVDLKQAFVFGSGRISPQFWEVFHKPTTSLCFSLLIFQQLRSILLCKDAFQAHLWQKLAFSSPFFYFNDLSSILSSGGMVMLLSSLNISNCEDRVLFVLVHLIGVSCPLFKFFPFCQVLPPFSTGALSEIFLTHGAILSIVPEVVCCWFHQASSNLVKFMFNSFHLQS